MAIIFALRRSGARSSRLLPLGMTNIFNYNKGMPVIIYYADRMASSTVSPLPLPLPTVPLSLSLSALSARLQLISTLSNLSLSTVSCLGIHLIFMRSKMLRPRSPPNMVHIHFAVTVCAPSFFTNSLREQRRLFIIFMFIARRAGCTFPRPYLSFSLLLFLSIPFSLTLPTPVSFMCFMKFFA